MTEIKTVTDDPEFVCCNNAVLKCQAEALKVADRIAEIELEILIITEIIPADDQWNRFQAGSTIDAGARRRIDALRAEQSDLHARD